MVPFFTSFSNPAILAAKFSAIFWRDSTNAFNVSTPRACSFIIIFTRRMRAPRIDWRAMKTDIASCITCSDTSGHTGLRLSRSASSQAIRAFLIAILVSTAARSTSRSNGSNAMIGSIAFTTSSSRTNTLVTIPPS